MNQENRILYKKARNSTILSMVTQTFMLSAPTLWLFLAIIEDMKDKLMTSALLAIPCTIFLTYRWIRTIDGLKLLKNSIE